MGKLSEATEGTRFGRLTLRRTEVDTRGTRSRIYAVCTCDCGKSVRSRLDSLGVGILSCGCLNAENTKKKGRANKTHGMSTSPEYRAWSGMWDRCTREGNPKYPLYKDRAPPEAWKSFEAFFLDMGPMPEGYSLERKNNDEPYGPTNCEWIPLVKQARNRSTTVFICHKGVKLTLTEACALAGINRKTVTSRLTQSGWTIKQALGDDFDWWPVTSA